MATWSESEESSEKEKGKKKNSGKHALHGNR